MLDAGLGFLDVVPVDIDTDAAQVHLISDFAGRTCTAIRVEHDAVAGAGGHQRQAIERVGRNAIVGNARALHTNGPHVTWYHAVNLLGFQVLLLDFGGALVGLVVIANNKRISVSQFLVIVVEVVALDQMEQELVYLAQMVLAALRRSGDFASPACQSCR